MQMNKRGMPSNLMSEGSMVVDKTDLALTGAVLDNGERECFVGSCQHFHSQ